MVGLKHFLIREEGNDTDLPQEIRIDARVLNRMIDQKNFRMDKPVVIRRPNKLSRTEISLCLKRDALFPISGFPRRLHSDKITHAGQLADSRHCDIIANNEDSKPPQVILHKLRPLGW